VKIAGAAQLDSLDFTRAGGLLPVVAQHADTGEVLMLAYADRRALELTLEHGVMWYYSRSRAALWRKGETSGNVQQLVSLHTDCDSDALVAHVLPAGPSCHTGEWSCFAAAPVLAALDEVIAARAASVPADAPASYTQRLLADPNLRLKKLGEEAVELALACERGEPGRIREEAADVLYHVLVACRAAGVTAADVLAALAARSGGLSGGRGAAGAPAEGGTATAG
jgi:phosphoribosyl-AMP cyclohydrolase / phosphoribosyl-ATP pyrophosphohydrolase